MARYYFGDLLREARKELGLTQEELAFGICSVGTISKIENGTSIPRKQKYEALLQRIGKSSCIRKLQLSRLEVEQDHALHKIRRWLADNETERAQHLLRQDFPMEKQTDSLSQQYILSMQGIIHSQSEAPADEVLEELGQALSCTGLSIGDYANLKRFYTFNEVIIINNIAIQHYRKKEYRDTFFLWDMLKVYFEKRIVDTEEKEQFYPMILHNYALLLHNMGIKEKAVLVCDLGIRYCEKHEKLQALPYLLYCRGESMDEQQQAQPYYNRADALFEAMPFHFARVMSPLYIL